MSSIIKMESDAIANVKVNLMRFRCIRNKTQKNVSASLLLSLTSDRLILLMELN